MKTAQLSPLASRLIQVAAVGATALLTSSAAFAGIAATKHNLGSSGSGPNTVNASATAEICVFCHTPHGANTTAPVPLWNKALGSGTASYSLYSTLGTSTLDAAELTVGSVSLACLSCHDGTQAMDSMINKPGSGGYNSSGPSAGYTWAQGAAVMTGTPIPMLGTDLTNDHPIGIQYCGGPASGTTVAADITSTLCRDKDFNTAAFKSINSNPSWWVDTSVGTTNTREKTDMILYTRTFASSGGAGPSVECASCHDPHVESKATNQVAFLRVSQAGSGVCLACHTK